MSTALIITCVVAVALLILVIASKTFDILIGLLGTIGGIVAYFWLGSTDSWMTQLKIAFEYGVNPADLKTYSIIAIVVGVVLLVIGLVRGRKPQKIVVVQQQAPVAPVTPAPAPETKKEAEKKEPKVKKVKEEPKTKEVEEESKEEEAKKAEEKEENKAE